MRLRVLLAALLWLGCDRPAPLSPEAMRPIPQGGAAVPTLEGAVVAIHDGDTLSLQAGGRRIRVRLAQIDAPERGQPWGRRAQRALAGLAEGRSARLSVIDRDAYGRTVGDLFVGDVFVNEALVREGHAWVFPRYVRSQRVVAAEAEARRERRGLWRLPPAERMPPWEWRRSHPHRSRGERVGAGRGVLWNALTRQSPVQAFVRVAVAGLAPTPGPGAAPPRPRPAHCETSARPGRPRSRAGIAPRAPHAESEAARGAV